MDRGALYLWLSRLWLTILVASVVYVLFSAGAWFG
jgi:hypothetical protein